MPDLAVRRVVSPKSGFGGRILVLLFKILRLRDCTILDTPFNHCHRPSIIKDSVNSRPASLVDVGEATMSSCRQCSWNLLHDFALAPLAKCSRLAACHIAYRRYHADSEEDTIARLPAASPIRSKRS